jgi:hypothetical protein
VTTRLLPRALSTLRRGTLALLLCPGCMLITRGSSQTIDVQTNPPGASVSIRPAPTDSESTTTPTRLSLRRKPASTVNVSRQGDRGAAYIVTASYPGYKDVSVPIESISLAGDTWVRNLIWIHPFGLLLGVLVDVSSGAAYELRPSSILIVLEPETGGAALQPSSRARAP